MRQAATNDEYTRKLKKVYSITRRDRSGNPLMLGFEGWKSLIPTSEVINGTRQWFLNSGQSFSDEVGTRWARLENGILVPHVTMQRNCNTHGDCTTEKCRRRLEGCHGGRLECSHECHCGIYAHSNVPDADNYGGRGSVALVVRLLSTGKGRNTIDDTSQGSKHLQSGSGIGVRSPEATITGIIEPTIYQEANEEERKELEQVVQRFAAAYGNVPILRRDENGGVSQSSLTSSQWVHHRYESRM